MRCVLPYPPSINHYWRHVGNKVLVSKEGRQYREAVAQQVRSQFAAAESDGLLPLAGRLGMTIDVHVPDLRRRDLDNVQKALLDALGHAGLYDDDSQIDWLLTRRAPLLRDGCVIVAMHYLPTTRCVSCGGHYAPATVAAARRSAEVA